MFNSILHHWMLWTGITSVTVAMIAVVLLIPTAGPIIAAFLTPIASAIGTWFGLWLTDLATGLRLMLSSVAGIIFCLSIFGAGVLIGDWYFAPKSVDNALKDLHANFICKDRPKHKKYVTTWYDPWTWIF